jgi:hypothetical protein
MFDWIGSLRITERNRMRVALRLSPATRLVGWALVISGCLIAWRAWPVSMWLALIPGAVALFGLAVTSLRREMVFDREAGVLRMDQSAFGIQSRQVVPLFHLRAVVIVARAVHLPRRLLSSTGFVAYVDRRVGDAIFLDEARRSAGLFRMAEAIAEVADLRLEYEAAPPAEGEAL